MTRTKIPPPPVEAHKPPLMCGCFGFTQADLERPRHEEIDAASFARCYAEQHLITPTESLKRKAKT